jgi:type I restriction enzyme M protein
MGIRKFSEVKIEYDQEYLNQPVINSIVPVNLKINKQCSIKNNKNEPNEEFYKWQLIYSLINSGMYSREFIGTEVSFPKGNKNSAPIKFDVAIFKSNKWFSHYAEYHKTKKQDELDWLRENLICVIEIKKENNKNIEIVYNQQLKPGMKEAENNYVLGMLYDTGKLYLFQKRADKFLRYDETLNRKGEKSTTKELSLDIPDAYYKIPSFDQLLKKYNYMPIDRSNRTVMDLDIISGALSSQLSDSIGNILKIMDAQSMTNERGYEILIQILALKIFDEKRSEDGLRNLELYIQDYESRKVDLLFFIRDKEREFIKLSDEDIQTFIKRLQALYDLASQKYHHILKDSIIAWNKEEHVRIIGEIVKQFQDYSFIRSDQTDLYQLVFYQFASEFSKANKGQFVTPIPVIEFIVDIINPKRGETIVDPTVGIADFLALAYNHSDSKLNDENLYGVDNDEHMIMLAQLNMLLNGDGNSNLQYKPDKGSLLWKFNSNGVLVDLDPKIHKNGNWDTWYDQTKLKKFDIVLTNPPFGEGRKYEPTTTQDREILELYELWNIARESNSIDPGLIFLENAYRVLNENGRIGIILSNSLASVKKWEKARNWLLEKVRIVAIFDLPANIFADTGVNTTVLIAYKPSAKQIDELKKKDYSIFVKNIEKVGYEVKTIKRTKYFEKLYLIDKKDFSYQVDSEGNAIIDEDFTKTVAEFKKWCLSQEEELKSKFL